MEYVLHQQPTGESRFFAAARGKRIKVILVEDPDEPDLPRIDIEYGAAMHDIETLLAAMADDDLHARCELYVLGLKDEAPIISVIFRQTSPLRRTYEDVLDDTRAADPTAHPQIRTQLMIGLAADVSRARLERHLALFCAREHVLVTARATGSTATHRFLTDLFTVR